MMVLQTIQQISVENMLLRMLVFVILKKENADISIGRYNSYDETRYVYMTYVTDPDDSLEVIVRKSNHG